MTKETPRVRTHRRRWSVVAAIAILLGSFVIGATNAPIAAADTLQNNACLGVTGTFSTFPVPITEPRHAAWHDHAVGHVGDDRRGLCTDRCRRGDRPCQRS